MKLNFTSLVKEFKSDYEFAGSVPKGLLFLTNDSASNQRLILVDPKNPDRKFWKNILSEKEFVLESITLAGNSIIAKYLENVSSKVYQFDLSGKLIREIKLPVLGTVSGISGDMKSQVLYYAMVSYTFPSRVYQVDLKTGNTSLYFKPEIDFDSDAFETKQVWYTSKDGTKIPMFITHKKGLKIDGNNPTFLFGYGGFNISYTPEFRVDRTVFLENNGVYCVANIRGGGEFGEKWHKAGTKLQKQNVFDDFIAAAEYLISSGYTNKNKLAIHGRSNGGLLAGACLTQRPDLFKCVIPQVGVLDMLKFHKFTIGWAWTGDYGSSENKEEFDYLKKYSPVHNVKEIAYPATLVVTGDHDDRVVPAHSFKFIAELQYKQKGDAPVLVRIDSGGGHGAGKPLSMQIAEYSDMWTFVFANLEMSFAQK
jgi:prolyl oligopeptidase